MRLNADGFYEPYITEPDRCTDCGMCLRVCSYANQGISTPADSSQPDAYAAWSNLEQERSAASSGGIAAAIVRHAMDDTPGKCRALGVRYNPDEARAEHFVATDATEALEMRGSKYIQSYTSDGIRAIDFRDKSLRWVASGTPCQIDSLRRLIKARRAEDRFLLVDFFCHGVPSRLIWLKYLAEKGLDRGLRMSWRSKAEGWQSPFAVTATDPSDGRVVSRSTQADGNIFFKLFFSNNCLNRCCYAACKFKGLSTAADIRVGDFWSDRYAGESKGVSVAIAMSDKGKHAFDSLSSDCTLRPVSPQDAVEGQMKQPLVMRAWARSLSLSMLRLGLPLGMVNMVSRIARHI